MRPPTVTIDFDGTLIRSDSEGRIEIVPGAREATKEFRKLGYRIVIFTCRTGIARRMGRLTEEVRMICQILEDHDIEYDEIFTGEKPVADVYIDDRAVAFRNDWEQSKKEAIRILSSRNYSPLSSSE